MRRFLLDTGILVHYVRKSSKFAEIEAKENLTSNDCLPMISVVTYGEILSFAYQNSWGQPKIQLIQKFISKIIVLDVNSGDTTLINTYAEIDTFSKGRLPGRPSERSAITMGKNDLWIAATAKTANATLLTIDSDFDHLDDKYITVRKY